MTLLAVPPGQHPTRTTPKASSSGRASSLLSSHAREGIMRNCASSPIRMSLGCCRTGLKSDGRSVSPMPNITTPSIGVMAEVPIQANEEGRKSATTVTSTTIRVMCAAIHADKVKILFFIALYSNFFVRTVFVIFGETFFLQEQTKGDDESSGFSLQKYENLG